MISFSKVAQSWIKIHENEWKFMPLKSKNTAIMLKKTDTNILGEKSRRHMHFKLQILYSSVYNNIQGIMKWFNKKSTMHWSTCFEVLKNGIYENNAIIHNIHGIMKWFNKKSTMHWSTCFEVLKNGIYENNAIIHNIHGIM